MYTTELLADFISGFAPSELRESQRKAFRQCLLDLLGVAAIGFKTEAARIMRQAAHISFRAGESLVWFSPSYLSAAGAALVNAASASALDIDDGHRGAAGHPGASIIPAALAVAQETKASVDEFIAAALIGYEIACRLGASRDFDKLPTLSTGRWCASGAAAAAGQLKRLKPSALAQALAIAGAQVPDLAASGYSKIMGNQVKEGIPWATMLGVVAADLASLGFTGPLDIFDHQDYFKAKKITADLGKTWAIESLYFKPYSSCRWSHAAIDAILAIMKTYGLNYESIKRIRVETFSRALTLNNYPDPDSLEAAQYSIPFCLGLAAVRGPHALLPLAAESLHDRPSVAVAKLVELTVAPDLNRLFPTKTPARVVVDAREGTFAVTVLDAKGDPANPLTPEELETKFNNLSSSTMSAATRREIINAVKKLDQGGFQRLTGLLSLP